MSYFIFGLLIQYPKHARKSSNSSQVNKYLGFNKKNPTNSKVLKISTQDQEIKSYLHKSKIRTTKAKDDYKK